MVKRFPLLLLVFILCTSTSYSQTYDVIIRHGMIYDGTGAPPFRGDLAIAGDTIAAVGVIPEAHGTLEIDATGLAVSPGFINMLSHAEESLLLDPRSEGDIRQGVTLEVFGEGSMGPLNDSLRKMWQDAQGDLKYPVSWSTLGGYFDLLEKQGIATNVASFVGAGTVRSNVLRFENRKPTPEELDSMKSLVRIAMEEGAMGLTTALIYTPDVFATTDELIALAKVVAPYGGMFTAHMRSEGSRLVAAVDEMLTISRQARLPVEIYHLKAAGAAAWSTMDSVITKIESARAEGVPITADMYLYIAGATGLDAAMPPWVQEGGYNAWAARLKDPAIRQRVKSEMQSSDTEWENLYMAAGSPEKIILVGFKNDTLKGLIGKTLAEVSKMRGTSPEETAMDLVIEDGTRVSTVYFLMSEENVKKQIPLPWVSFCSDAESMSPEGVFLKSNPHPRAYGNFARLLGKYVRDEKLLPLEEAIRKLTSLPASNLRLEKRGKLAIGHFADVAVFDPSTVQDHATFERPHQLSTGFRHVFVNGKLVLRDGVHTGATPGRIIRGPGYHTIR